MARLFVVPAACCVVVMLASFVIDDQLREPARRGQTEAEQMYVLAQALTDTVDVSERLARREDATGVMRSLTVLRRLNQRISAYAVPELEALGPVQLLHDAVLDRPELLEQLAVEGNTAARRLVLRGREFQQLAANRERTASQLFTLVLAGGLLFSLVGMRLGARYLTIPTMGPMPLAATTGADLGQLLLDHSQDGVCITDAVGTIVEVNRTYEQRTGYSADEARGLHVDFDLAPQPGGSITVERAVGEAWESDLWRRHKYGEAYLERCLRLPLRDAAGRVTGSVSIARDQGGGRETERLLHWQANHDALTKLPNRGWFLDRLATELRDGAAIVGVALVDLDRFKRVNDNYGYGAGDQVLVDVAARLALAVRPQDLLARFESDHFAVMLREPLRSGEASSVLRAIQDRLAVPLQLGERPLSISASLGVALAPSDASAADALVGAAERALELVKSQGGDGFRFFEAAMNTAAARRVQLEGALRRAIALGQLHVHYQPIVDVAEVDVYGVEALLRWQHPELGAISPVEFIPLAEQCGMIEALGDFVVDRVLAQLDLWSACGIDRVAVSINVSGHQLRSASGREELRRRVCGRHAERLCLEITESVLVDRDDEVRTFLADLRAAGVRIAIDDFGTGFSSLGYLLHFPVDVVKVDKSFVDAVEEDNKALALVATIEAMGRILGLTVVAEGVEHEVQLERLRMIGTRLVQGYLFARPMSAADTTRYLRGGMAGEADEQRLVG